MEIRSQPASFSRERTALLFDSRAREVELWMKTEKKRDDDFNVFNKNYSIAATSSPTLLFSSSFFAFLLQQKSQYLILISQRNSIRFIIIIVMHFGLSQAHPHIAASLYTFDKFSSTRFAQKIQRAPKQNRVSSSHSSISKNSTSSGGIYGKFPHIFDDTR